MTVMTALFKADDEPGRQCALERLDVLDTAPEPEFDKITNLVRAVFDVPIAAVSLIDRDRQWFKSVQGLETTETPRRVAFCNHTIRSQDILRIEDASVHPWFSDNPLVTGPPGIRSYIGAPLVTADGYAIGSLCAIDRRPRVFSDEQARVLASFADLVMNQLELRKMASVDLLTGLATRRAFAEAMDTAITESDRTGRPVSLICLDLDRFKAINDTFGHQTGDAVLVAVGDTVGAGCRDIGFAGRIGGEELAVLLVGTEPDDAAAFAEGLRRRIEVQTLDDHPQLVITASFGVAPRQPGMTAKAWMAAADAALYRAKHEGRNRVVSALTETAAR
ncbi:sensor domain-containing diguanylate cyclase [Paracoccus nototheniae]|uniref:diguanylate cyclase n=1 Tax=Paracoccus nototheniae TaxID=2489002 RepID=A0ABW4DYH8_9RHOB|nr:sensor domain-containing diguanylate cyclase [Paracoccus nototheniae]